jgi:hypothetical protein
MPFSPRKSPADIWDFGLQDATFFGFLSALIEARGRETSPELRRVGR